MVARARDGASSVATLSLGHLGEAVEVLSEAFYDYPVMRHVLRASGPRYGESLDQLVAFFCERRLAGPGSVLGVSVDGALAGVAVTDVPGSGDGEDDVAEEERRARVRRLVSQIGGEAVSRLREYDEVAENLMPAGSYHYLGMLGVRERFQGTGVGKRLVEATQASAEADRGSSGVCLHTETPGNVPLYEHLGFELVGEDEVAALRTWCMFWPCA
jgi:GNAT superfamily N-acetyltransferase